MGFDEIIDLLGAVSPVLSAVIAFITAKCTARHEIRKQERQWEREDDILENRDFSEMVAAVSRFVQSGWSKHQREAMERISRVQADNNDPALSALFNAVASGNTAETLSCLEIAVKSKDRQPTKRTRKPRK